MDSLAEFYKKMYLIRKVENVITENYYDDEMKTPMHMSRGSEAISVGVCSALGSRGQYFSTYRSHAPYLASGGDVSKFFAEMYGKKDGRYAGKAGSMHIASPETGHMSSSAIVASNIPVAVGASWANKIKDNGKIVVVFFGDGAMEEGNFWESINMASLWKLPIIFVLEDNRLAVNTPACERQGFNDITELMAGFNVDCICGDGIEVENVYRETVDAIKCIDIYQGPFFMQFKYYRYLEHVGVNSDSDEKYRKFDSFSSVDENDPLICLRKKVQKRFVIKIKKEIDQKVDKALKYAKASEFSEVNEVYKDVFYG